MWIGLNILNILLGINNEKTFIYVGYDAYDSMYTKKYI